MRRKEWSELSLLQFSIVQTLLWSLSNAEVPPIFQSGPNPFTLDAQTVTLKSPLLRSIVSRLEPAAQPSDSFTDEFRTDSPVKSASFLNSFIQHLETRRSLNQSSTYEANHLELQIRDGSSNIVNIEFNHRPDDQQEWNSLIDLLADSLAFVVQEAEIIGYKPNFKYSVISGPTGYKTRLGALALKSAAG